MQKGDYPLKFMFVCFCFHLTFPSIKLDAFDFDFFWPVSLRMMSKSNLMLFKMSHSLFDSIRHVSRLI